MRLVLDYSGSANHYWEKTMKHGKTRYGNSRYLEAMPPWADKHKIENIYKERAEIASLLSCTHQELNIDHIIPRTGKVALGGYVRGFHAKSVHVVCGLHVHNNLSISTREDNWDKGCHYWPDMPEYSQEDLDELKIVAVFLRLTQTH